eukprot:SAG31_NODE_243_length_19342_cov_12.906459_24_plen_70_part_00
MRPSKLALLASCAAAAATRGAAQEAACAADLNGDGVVNVVGALDACTPYKLVRVSPHDRCQYGTIRIVG